MSKKTFKKPNLNLIDDAVDDSRKDMKDIKKRKFGGESTTMESIEL